MFIQKLFILWLLDAHHHLYWGKQLKKKKKLHPLLGYALQLQQSDINISEQP